MSLSAQFTRIAEDTDRSPHDRLVEAVQVYKIEHPETDELTAQRAVFAAMPEVAREYLDSNT
jgi:hypothetical protein